MLWTPTPRFTPASANNWNGTPSLTHGTSLTSSGVANTKSTPETLISSVPYDVEALAIVVNGTSGAGTERTDTLLDLCIGGAGSEVVVVSNLLVGWRTSVNGVTIPSSFNIKIRKGERLSASFQGEVVTKIPNVEITLFGSDAIDLGRSVNRYDAYGVSASGASSGTPVTAGNASWSTWTNIGSTTSRAYKCLMVYIQGLSTGNVQNTVHYYFQIGINDTAIATVDYLPSTNEYSFRNQPLATIFKSIPAGTQFQARGYASTTPQTHQLAIYGGY